MKLPSEKQCGKYFSKYKVPPNVFNHCRKVREVAVFLAKRLKASGLEISLELVDRAALLHDLFKLVSLADLKTNKYHQDFQLSEEEEARRQQLREKFKGLYEGEIAYEVFKGEFPELALVLKRVSDTKNRSPTWEERVVHYADWRVFKEKIVPLQKRLDYLEEVYPREKKVWEEYSQFVRKQEKKIMSRINLKAEELEEEVKRTVEGAVKND